MIGDDESAAKGEPLTVATYNVYGLRKRETIRRDLAELGQVNVWCLQEFPYRADFRFEDVLPPGRWHVAALPLHRDGGRAWESQMIASRFPIEHAEAWPLDDGSSKRRAALAARVNVNGSRVLVVNTDHEPSILAWRDRNAVQADGLVRRLRACEDEAVVVAGDFNCSGNIFRLRGNESHVKAVDSDFAKAGFGCATANGSTYRGGLVRSRIDRIYVHGMRCAAGAIAAESRGSDHLPVWAQFEPLADAPHPLISDPSPAQ